MLLANKKIIGQIFMILNGKKKN